MDNYQEVGDDTLLHEVVCSAVSTLQKQITLFILSRKAPPKELARARAKCRMEMLGWKQLRMDIEETSGVIHSISGQRLNEETIAEIHAKTDGWVSGLLLLLKRGSFDQVEPCMLARKTPEVIFDYLNDSVFQDLAENHQRMLLTLCFMPVVSARAASVLCGRDAPEVMEMLSKDNRFIYRIWTGR